MIGTHIAAVFFLGMGLAGLAAPAWTVGFIRLGVAHRDARNEVRAVYGGFGVAVAALLWATLSSPSGHGVRLAVAVSLLGMAGGRVVATCIERPGRWPALFFAVECALAALLLHTP